MMRGTRSRYFASILFTHKSAGSLACESVETMKYLFGSPTRAVRCHPVWPGVSRRHKFGALISVRCDWLMEQPPTGGPQFLPVGRWTVHWPRNRVTLRLDDGGNK